MSFFQKVIYHLPRVKSQLGVGLKLGRRQYRVQGYHPNRLARDFDDEPYMLPVLQRVLGEREGVFLDVGANLGQTLIKVLAVDPNRAYVGFEPQLECCFYIEQFLRVNSISQAQIVPVALSDANTMVPLFWDQPNDTTASMLDSHAYSPAERRPHLSWVSARVGDDLVREMEINQIAAVKIDVEGFELEVIRGLSDTIARMRPVILFEVLSNYFWNSLIDDNTRKIKSKRADQIHRLFCDANYTVAQLDNEGNEHRIEGFDLDRRPSPNLRNEGRDYIARPVD